MSFEARDELPTAIVSAACACASLPIAIPLVPPEVAPVPMAMASAFSAVAPLPSAVALASEAAAPVPIAVAFSAEADAFVPNADALLPEAKALYPIAAAFSAEAWVLSLLSSNLFPSPPPIAIEFAAVAAALRPNAVALPPVAIVRKPMETSPNF